VAREAESVNHARRVRRRADHRQQVIGLGLHAGPCADDPHVAHARKEIGGRARALRQLAVVDRAKLGVEIGLSLQTAANDERALPRLLEGQRAPDRADDRIEQRRQPFGDDHHRRLHAERNVVADERGDTCGPGARCIDDGRRDETLFAGADQPVGALAFDRGDAAALVDCHARGLAASTKRTECSMRIGRAVPPRHQRTNAMRAQRGHEPAQLGRVDDFFVRIAKLPQLRRAVVQIGQMSFGFRNPDLAVRMKAASVANDRLDAMPHVHRFQRDRHFRQVAAERADAGGGRT
jgi:hypothetical protein